MDKAYVQVFHDGKVEEHVFHNLLDGLHWLKVTNAVFDHIIIDDEITVTFEEFDAYFNKVNDFCHQVYGTYY
jgi:hypothetical protein